MRRSRGLIYAVAMSVLSTAEFAGACSIQVRYTQHEINEAREKLYEREFQLWDRDPTYFDLKDPLLGELLSSRSFFETELEKWKSHPIAFEHENPFLWRVLDGDWLYHEKHPFPALNPMLPIDPPAGPAPWEPGPIDPDPQGKHKVGGSLSPASSGPIPEPSAALLMLTGLILSLLGVGGRRALAVIRSA